MSFLTHLLLSPLLPPSTSYLPRASAAFAPAANLARLLPESSPYPPAPPRTPRTACLNPPLSCVVGASALRRRNGRCGSRRGRACSCKLALCRLPPPATLAVQVSALVTVTLDIADFLSRLPSLLTACNTRIWRGHPRAALYRESLWRARALCSLRAPHSEHAGST